ncbi:MAG: glutamine amidotransferase [Oculatellaceae cyanobacterium Prado106]|jgi:GMP synthase (glutamine-hydrolysing)|nr:glutamine amidotransferase [Oculatellaceae cyanobacterium Prado106]
MQQDFSSVRKILIVVHQPTSEPGLVGQKLRQAHWAIETCCPALEQPLPSNLDGYGGVIVFGGPMSANDDQTLPFIRAELDWIPLVLASGTPYLGICLGAQLLARVLGAKVTPHAEGIREIGYCPLQPTPGQTALANLSHVYHWHKEGFEIPHSAVQLAAGAVFPNQAFCYGTAAYGVQFHPEITPAMIERWTSNAPEQLQLPGAQSLEEQRQHHDRHSTQVEQWLEGFLQNWLDAGQVMPLNDMPCSA